MHVIRCSFDVLTCGQDQQKAKIEMQDLKLRLTSHVSIKVHKLQKNADCQRRKNSGVEDVFVYFKIFSAVIDARRLCLAFEVGFSLSRYRTRVWHEL